MPLNSPDACWAARFPRALHLLESFERPADALGHRLVHLGKLLFQLDAKALERLPTTQLIHSEPPQIRPETPNRRFRFPGLLRDDADKARATRGCINRVSLGSSIGRRSSLTVTSHNRVSHASRCEARRTTVTWVVWGVPQGAAWSPVIGQLQGSTWEFAAMTSISANADPHGSGDFRSYARMGYVAVGLVFGAFGGWAAIAPLDSAAHAPARVAVEGDRKPIQHL